MEPGEEGGTRGDSLGSQAAWAAHADAEIIPRQVPREARLPLQGGGRAGSPCWQVGLYRKWTEPGQQRDPVDGTEGHRVCFWVPRPLSGTAQGPSSTLSPNWQRWVRRGRKDGEESLKLP